MVDRRKLLSFGLGAGLSLAGPLAAAAREHRGFKGHGHHAGLRHASVRHGGHGGGHHHTRRTLLSAEPPLKLLHPERVSFEPRVITLKNRHTDEALEAVYWDKGEYVPDALDAVNHVLRDYRTGEVHPIDPNLLDVLTDLRASLESRSPYQVISGYRSPQTNAMLHERSAEVARKSLHVEGMAIDIYLDDVSLERLRLAALELSRGGVGYYPVSRFVHVDVGPVRHWEGA